MENLAAGFGQGWMSAPARDLVKIAVQIAGFDQRDLARRLAFAGTGSINVATVERILGEMESA